MALIDKQQLDYKLPLHASAPDFTLPATDGNTYSRDEFTKPLLVLFFWCNHCPYVHAAENRTIEIARKFAHVADFVAINSNDSTEYPEDNFEAMQARVLEKGYPFFYLYDETQEVAKAYGAECTPQFFIFDKDRKLRYQGRLDDAGTHPEKAGRSELLEALIALSQGKEPEQPFTSAMGCSVKWRF